jgi:hypothetical protein
MCMALQRPGAEKDQQERSRAHLTLKQVTRSPGNCDELNFQDAATLLYAIYGVCASLQSADGGAYFDSHGPWM